MTEEMELIQESLIKGQATRVRALVQVALENKVPPMTILREGLFPGMDIVGRKFRDNFIYISDVLISSRAMHAGMHVLKPYLSKNEKAFWGKVVIGTVAGDLHDIGKNLVAMMFRGAGLEVIDLGVDVEPEDFIKAVTDNQPEIVAMSAMLTTTLEMMKETIEELEAEGLRDEVKIIVGGAPVTKEFAYAINADGFSDDLTEVVDLAKELLNKDAKTD